MGKSYTPTFRVEYRDNTNAQILSFNPMAWDCKMDGRPTVANLEKWRQGYNKSFNPGGVNFHVSKEIGVIIHISNAKLIRQSTGEVVAETAMPMFEVM